jgi:hypothetical protein
VCATVSRSCAGETATIAPTGAGESAAGVVGAVACPPSPHPRTSATATHGKRLCVKFP